MTPEQRERAREIIEWDIAEAEVDAVQADAEADSLTWAFIGWNRRRRVERARHRASSLRERASILRAVVALLPMSDGAE